MRHPQTAMLVGVTRALGHVVILVPIALFASLSWQGLGTRNEGLWRQKIYSPKFYMTSVLHVFSRDVSIYSMGKSWRLLLPLKISFFQTANQKNLN